MSRKIRVGLDFDGVVAYNPFRLARAPWAYFKRRVLGVRKLTFFYPTTKLQKLIWLILHDSSIFPARGMRFLSELIDEDKIEAHLITGRYSFLDGQLRRWLDKYGFTGIFKTINWNKEDSQPHIFKEQMINNLKLNYFIEDNWDIVEYLKKKKMKTKIYWIYNLIVHFQIYEHKYPYLEKALRQIVRR